MDISIKIGKIIWKCDLSLFLCELLLFSILIPSRGRVFGISCWPNLIILVCFVGQFLATRKMIRDIPKFCVVYILISIFCLIVHFSDRSLVNNVITIIQYIAPVYVIMVGITSMDKLMTMLKFTVKVFTVYGILGIVETVTHFNFFDALTGTQVVYEHANALRFGLARNRGALDVSINNGMLLCLVLCVAAYVLLCAPQKERKFYQICYIIIFADTFLTLSRAIWLELVVTQVLIFLALAPRKQLKIVARIILTLLASIMLLACVNAEVLEKIIYVIKEMFSSTYDAFTGSNTAESGDMSYGVGHRFLLWEWVWEKTQGYIVLGTGYSIPFVYIASPTYIKRSIEVMWLYMFYHGGFVGLFGYIVYQIGSIFHMIRGNKVEKILFSEKKVTFNYVMLIASVLYFFTQFSCSAFEDLRFFAILLSIVFVYNRICRIEVNKQ